MFSSFVRDVILVNGLLLCRLYKALYIVFLLQLIAQRWRRDAKPGVAHGPFSTRKAWEFNHWLWCSSMAVLETSPRSINLLSEPKLPIILTDFSLEVNGCSKTEAFCWKSLVLPNNRLDIRLEILLCVSLHKAHHGGPCMLCYGRKRNPLKSNLNADFICYYYIIARMRHLQASFKCCAL